MDVVFSRLRQFKTIVQALTVNPGWQLGAFLLGLAAGRAFFGGLAPFTSSAAVTAAVFLGPSFWPSLVGMLVGVATRPSVSLPASSLESYLVIIAAVFIARRYKNYFKESPVPAALLSGGINLGVKYFVLLFQGTSPGFLPALISESALAGIFMIPFHYVFCEYKKQKGLFLILALVLVYCGLGDLSLGPTVFREVLGRSVLLVVASGWGGGFGAAAGVILGLFSGSFVSVLPRTGFYAATGFFSGILKNYGPPGVILGFFLSCLFFSASYGQPENLFGHLWASVIAVVLYLAAWRLIPYFPGKESTNFSKMQPLYAEVGYSQRPKPTETLCGDSIGLSHLDPRRLLLTVSDGMGAGVNAARESRIVVKLMEQLLGNNVGPEAAAGIVNTALYLRGGEESAATIDTALIDLNAATMEFLKVGAPPSFIKRGEVLEIIRSACWPAGILDEVDVQILTREILPGDILIMVTDGVTEVNLAEKVTDDWMYNYIRDLPMEEAQVIADLVLKHALKTAGFEHRDDMTVLVARFCRERELE